jgi:hypothetical protein
LYCPTAPQATSYLMESTTGFSFFFSLLQVLIGW